MVFVLIIEIVSALVALISAIIIFVQFIKARKHGCEARRPKNHVITTLIMIVGAIVHGTAAMIYASGAPIIAYVLGWTSLACFVLAGIIMMAPKSKKNRSGTRTLHVHLFLLGILFFIAHAIAGRL